MYKPYSVKYVERLEIIVKCTIFSIGLAVPVGLYLMIPKAPLDTFGVIEHKKPSVKSRVDALQEERKLPTEVRIKQLTQAKVDSQIRSFIKKMNPKLSYTEVDRITKLEQKSSRQYGVPLEIGLAITMQESGFRPQIVSYTGCCFGLKQVNFKAHKGEYGIQTLGDVTAIEKNIEIGYQMIANHYKKYGTYPRALQRYYGATDPVKNVEYARQVLAKAKRLREIVT